LFIAAEAAVFFKQPPSSNRVYLYIKTKGYISIGGAREPDFYINRFSWRQGLSFIKR